MIYQKLVKNKLLIKEKVDFRQIHGVIERAHRDIKSAITLIEDGDYEGSFRFAYEAMLLAGRALVFSFGFRPRAIGSHKIVVDFTEKVLGKEFKVLTQKFNRMRKKRNYLIYGINLTISKTEAKNAVKSAEEFVDIIQKFIQKRNPQKKLI